MVNELEEFFNVSIKPRILTCGRCHRKWLRKSMKKLPKNCACCNSPLWNKPRKRKLTPLI
jgi:uncharacterized CHY-type Zn-finger protein